MLEWLLVQQHQQQPPPPKWICRRHRSRRYSIGLLIVILLLLFTLLYDVTILQPLQQYFAATTTTTTVVNQNNIHNNLNDNNDKYKNSININSNRSNNYYKSLWSLLVHTFWLQRTTTSTTTTTTSSIKISSILTNNSKNVYYSSNHSHGGSSTPVSSLSSTTTSTSHHNNNTTTTFASNTTTTTVTTTIVVKVSGEMCNYLSKLATGFGLQRWIQDRYNTTITTKIVIRHLVHRRWKRATKNIHKCFPYLRQYDFSQGNTEEYEHLQHYQQEWLGNVTSSRLVLDSIPRNESDMEQALSTLDQIHKSWNNHSTLSSSSSFDYYHNNNNNTITLPFLETDYLAMIDIWIDKYYDDYRSTFFKFDEMACCRLKPDPDESVFHFRNFLTELRGIGKRMGFEELNPNDTAHLLFRNLHAGDKLAITSRYSNHQESIQPYVDAFVNRGIQVRVIRYQSDVQDFCFLLHAQKELVGYAESSFAVWAGYLGNASRVRLYSIDSPSRRASYFFGHRVLKYYNWTHPKLQQKVFFEFYHAT